MKVQPKDQKKKLLNYFVPVREDELIECGHDSENQFRRLKNIEGSCLILNSTILVFCFLYYEMNYRQIWKEYHEFVLISIQICSLILSIQTYFRFSFHLKLLVIRQKVRRHEGVYSSGIWKNMIIEMVVGCIHPNYFLHGKSTC